MAHRDPDRPRSQHNGHSRGKKRKHEQRGYDGVGHTLSLLRQPDLPEFNLTSARRPSDELLKQDEQSRLEGEDEDEGGEWQTIEGGRPTKKLKKIPKANSSNYPAIKFSYDSRLQSPVKISDIQNLVLYILADGLSPQFVSVRQRPQIRKVVVLLVPGLEQSMFVAEKKRQEDRSYSPDDYYPIRLRRDEVPSGLKAFAEMFEDLWPVKTPGDDKYGKMHSPLHAILTAPVPKGKEEQKNKKKNKGGGAQQVREPIGWKSSRTPITDFVHTPEVLLENDYTLHPALYDNEMDKLTLATHRSSIGTSREHGWVDTIVKNVQDGTPPDNEIEQGSLTAGREVLAMDCEMCMTGEGEFSLTRISIVGWDGSVVLDELVKPAKPIKNYLTQYSGITEAMLVPITTTLADIQKKLIEILHPRTVLIGHSLNSDLTALKLTHPFIIDTAVIYPHPRGPPLKSSLKWLAQKYLNREIQKGHGTTGKGAGHDSVEDARTCLDLVKQKCEKGKEWGTSDMAGENIFKRVARTGVKYKNQGGSAIPSPINGKSSAMVDWGDPKKGAGAAATHVIGCKNDDEVVEGIIRAVNGDPNGKEILGGGVDFVFGRLRELEALKGWWNNNKLASSTDSLVEAEAKGVATAAQTGATETREVEQVLGAAATNEIETSTSKNAAEAIQAEQVEISMSEASEILPVEEPSPTNILEQHTLSGSTSAVSTETIASSVPPASSLAPTASLPKFVALSADTPISTATSDLVSRLNKIHASLPPCTAFVIYSGSGDPREMSRLQAMQAQFKREYKIKKWDQLTVKWTDTEEQALKKAVAEARNGIAFMSVK